MFLKQYNFKPRSNSQSSANSDSTKDNLQQASSPTESSGPLSQGQRRASVTEKFAGLQSTKRASTDLTADAKKASFMEQKPGNPGILGGMWNSFTKG